MDPVKMKLTDLLQREKIRDCIARVACGEDRRNAAVICASFWPDAAIDHGVLARSFEEYLGRVVPGAPAIPVTQHLLGQSLIELRSDTALVETEVTSYHRVAIGDENRDAVIGGRLSGPDGKALR